MGEKFAPFESRLAAFYGFDKTVLFLEVAGDDILHNLIRVEALLRCSLGKPGLQISVEMNFHAQNIRQNYS